VSSAPRRILMLCDWLPPDFGAVGQYALAAARALAESGHEVVLVGFTQGPARVEATLAGQGSLVVRRLHRPAYDRADWIARALWTLAANVVLLWGARGALARCEEVRFTGSPPYLVHFVVPLARLVGRRTRYRITDFHPECLFAALGRVPWWGRPLQALTAFWRRRVDLIEVLGEDQAERLRDSGVDPARVVLVRDPSPVAFDAAVTPATVPPAIAGRRIVLYSGNWGVAHDDATIVGALARRFAADPDGAPGLWLNAIGARADRVEAECLRLGLPLARTAPVPLDRLAGVLRAADVHLITLEDAFVGYVLPSKVYACIASGRPVLFIGSRRSDVHRLCAAQLPAARYRQVEVGDVEGAARALAELLPALDAAGAAA
jgi:hypothetical protein